MDRNISRVGTHVADRADHRFIFIGGLHRSGTTIFHDLLATHPQISGLSDTGVPMNEGQFLQDVFPPEGRYRKLWPIRHLRRLGLQRIAELGYGGPGRFAFDVGANLTERSPAASPENAENIFRAWEPYWDTRARYLAEKSPSNLIRMRFLQSLFPASYFIVVIRHPVPVSLATQRVWRTRTSLYSLFRHWLHASDLSRADQPHLERVLEIRYEELLTHPVATFDRVWAFLGVPPLEGMDVSSLNPGVNEKYFAQWREMRGSRIRRTYQAMLVRRFESSFRDYGYSLQL